VRFSDCALAKLLILLIILNIIDTGGTLYWISEGIATEANPIMQSWLQIHINAFIFIKLLMVFLCTVFLWLLRKRKLVHILIIPTLAVYIYIFIIHCQIYWLNATI
jgi:hypothetical protein